jgi:hypothetical protein
MLVDAAVLLKKGCEGDTEGRQVQSLACWTERRVGCSGICRSRQEKSLTMNAVWWEGEGRSLGAVKLRVWATAADQARDMHQHGALPSPNSVTRYTFSGHILPLTCVPTRIVPGAIQYHMSVSH